MFVVFIITMILLNQFLFKPILRTLEARQAKVDKNNSRSSELVASIESSEKDYQKSLAEVNETIRHARQEALQKAKDHANSVLTKVKEEAAVKIESAQADLAKNKDAALIEAETLSKELAEAITKNIIA